MIKKYAIRLLYCLLCISYTINTNGQNISANAIDSLKQQLSKPLPDSSRVLILSELAYQHATQNIQTALKYAETGMAIYERHQEKTPLHIKGELFNSTGVVYYMTPDYSKALFYFFQSLRFWEEANLTVKEYNYKIARCYNNIASCYTSLKQYEQAKKYFIVSLPLIAKEDRPGIYNNLGSISYTLNNLQEAITYYKKSIQEKKKNTSAYLNLGIIYTDLNNLKLAEYHYQQALAVNDGNIYTLIVYHNGLGQLYIKSHLFKKAEEHLLKAKEIAETSGISVTLEGIYENLSQMYEKQNDYKRANVYHKMLQMVKDSVYKESTAKQISEMQAKYESDKKDKELEISKTKAEKEYLLRNLIIAVSLSVFVIGLVVFRNIMLKQTVKNKALNEEKALVEKDNTKLLHENAEARYETLKNKVNPHFLFNNLTTLSSLIIKSQRTAIQYVERFSEFYRMILKTGEEKLITLSQEMQVVNHYLYLQQMWFKEDLQLHIHIQEDYNGYFVPTFAVQMLVENAIKHNTISVEIPLVIHIYTEDNTIIVSNNLQKKLSNVSSTFTGQKNIAERYRLLSDRKPEFTETASDYTVRLPLLEKVLNKNVEILT